eukprot:jgi/Botrbrau1/14061/Bobra.182_3s0008.1
MANQGEFKILEKKGIKEGDVVSTKYRGGTREGAVSHIATSTDDTPHPPKVVFTNQRGKEVQHNPSTLTKKTSEGSDEQGVN